MRRSAWVRVLAVVLVISMLAMPVSAAGLGGDSDDSWGLSDLIGLIRDIIRDLIGKLLPGEPQPTEPIETTPPTEPGETTVPTEPVETEPGETEPEETQPEETKPGETEPEETEPEETEPEAGENGVELNMVEGHKTTENGQLLRGVTYTFVPQTLTQSITKAEALKPAASLKSGLSKLSMNGAMLLAADDETTISDTALEIGSDGVIPNGRYVIYCDVDYAYTNDHGAYLTNSKTSDTPWNTTTLLGTDEKASATYFTFTRQTDGTYTIQGPAGNYLQITRNGSAIEAAVRYFSVEVKDDGIWLRDNTSGDCINALGADNTDLLANGREYFEKYFGGWTGGSPLKLYAVITGSTEGPSEPEQNVTEVELIYFPVTMFNYDQATINGFTDAMDDDTTIREGFYFSDGGSEVPAYFTTTTSMSSYVAGQYYIQNLLAKERYVDSWLQAYNQDGTNKIYGVSQSEATLWTLVIENDEFYLTCLINGETHYLKVGTDGDTDGYTTTKTPVTLSPYGHNATATQISQNGYYLSQWSEYSTDYCGRATNNDYGNGMLFYRVVDGVVSDTPVSPTSVNVITSGYQIWNRWGYSSNAHVAQNMFYGGLVEEQLDENNEIVFTVNEPGIFTFDAEDPTVTNDGKKDIYQNVGLPFVKNDKGYYTFDSDEHGTYFADTTGDGSSDPWYGAEDDFFNMYFDYQKTQGWAAEGGNLGYGDGSSNLWAPYNTNENDTGAGNIDYHFGMRADIPFSMTPNGCIKSTDNNSEHITFTFKGDDDVWIFIDGHLVIDLGGIHNRIGATIDFADNTITYEIPDSNESDTNAYPLGCYNDPASYPLNEDGTITVKLYNDTEGEGALGQTRFDFSSEEEHEMSIFYLERGKGTSNCQIEFNLPMRDTLLVTKDCTKSWSVAQDEADGDNGDGTVNLTAKEQAAVDKLDFYFKLYKKEAGSDSYTVVANTNYFLLDKDGTVLSIQTTGVDGKFPLKNGQTAKFMTDISKDGVTYYVEELELDRETFLSPDYSYAGIATYGFDYDGYTIDYDSEEDNATKRMTGHVSNAADIGEQELPLNATELKSYDVTAKGSIESIDSLQFICTNYLNAELPNPTARAYEDIIVIDYGLPVKIDPLHNDLFRGDTIEIVAWGDESLTLDEKLDAFNNAIPHDQEGGTSWSTPTQNFHSGTVEFHDVDYPIVDVADTSTIRDTFTYTLNKQMTEVEVISYIIKVTSSIKETIDGEVVDTKSACRYALAKVYIVPATIMYYEENFSDMVTFTGSGWNQNSTVDDSENVSAYQEPGVVGTVEDSTYGSDVAYLSDDGDSNGTYRFGDTTNGAIRFTYTFTGTGTSIFARTSADTGYMQVKIFAGEITDETDLTKDYLEVAYRDTYYKDLNGNTLDSDECLYNIPVYTSADLDYGTYTIVATVAKAGTPTENYKVDANGDPVVDENGQYVLLGSGNEFYLDGIRVMQPLDIVVEEDEEYDEEGNVIKPIVYDEITTKALGAYATDGESNLDVVTLRQKLLADNEQEFDPELGESETQWPFAVLTDVDGNIVYASDYKSIGPKEEVYLSAQNDAANAQSVSFSLKYWHPEGLKLYMGMKAPFGYAKVGVGQEIIELKNAPDCYYDITNFGSPTEVTDEEGTYYVITFDFEALESIVSLTNIKVVGNYEFIILEGEDIEIPGDSNE